MTELQFFSLAAVLVSLATLAYVVVSGWLVLKVFAQQPDRRIAKPLVSMVQVALISSVVFMLASVPSIVARVVNTEVLPFIMPYAAVLFAVSFVSFMLKLESKRSGGYQAAVAASLAALIAVALIVVQLLIDIVLISLV